MYAEQGVEWNEDREIKDGFPFLEEILPVQS
jgi:hypothetical protein